MKERIPEQPKQSSQKSLKSLYKKSDKRLSMKEFIRHQSKVDGEIKTKADNWFFNKTANFSKPPLGLGATRKKKGSKGK